MRLHKHRLLQQLQSRKPPPYTAIIRTDHNLVVHLLSQVAQATLLNLNTATATTTTEATEVTAVTEMIVDMAIGALVTALMTTMAQLLHQSSRLRPTLTTIRSRKPRAHS
jgi:hypothetical protein